MRMMTLLKMERDSRLKRTPGAFSAFHFSEDPSFSVGSLLSHVSCFSVCHLDTTCTFTNDLIRALIYHRSMYWA